MRTKFYLLNTTSEVYTSYVDINSVIQFLNRIRRTRGFVLFAQKGNKARVWELDKLETLIDLLREVSEFTNAQ